MKAIHAETIQPASIKTNPIPKIRTLVIQSTIIILLGISAIFLRERIIILPVKPKRKIMQTLM